MIRLVAEMEVRWWFVSTQQAAVVFKKSDRYMLDWPRDLMFSVVPR